MIDTPSIKYKIMYIDDEKGLLTLAKQFMERTNPDVMIECYYSSKQAFEAFEKGKFDGIISDYQMPEMSGLEILEIVRKTKKSDIPFIIFTGKGREDVAITALNLGANRYIQKGRNLKAQYAVLSRAIKKEVDHWRVQKALHESEEKYHELFEQARDPLLIIDPVDLSILESNKAASDILGYSKEELLNLTFQEICSGEHADNSEEVIKKREKVIKERIKLAFELGGFKFESYNLHKDGSTAPVEISFHRVSFLNEVAIQIVIRDISHRIINAEIIQKRLELETMILDITTSFVVFSPDTFDEKINNALQLIGEYSKSDICYLFLKSDDGEHYNYTHAWSDRGVRAHIPQLKDLPIEAIPWWLSQLNAGKHIYIPKVSEMPEEASSEKGIIESVNALSTLVVPVSASDELLGFLGIANNRKVAGWVEDEITFLNILGVIIAEAFEKRKAEQKLIESEARYHLLVDNLKEGAVVITENLEIEYVNKSMTEITGYSKEELLGSYPSLYMNEENYTQLLQKFAKRKDGKQEPYIVEIVKKDRSTNQVRISPISLFEKAGKFIGSISLIEKLD
ncbi:MAG: PAS domain S-box protein [Candidatus Heimdallarchaeota archaeon]|nr:PAS domain S-box protein [Candidatus Heimdallarchaeota archaeon]MCK5048134.1 PAS domain S-box protein [Candidatus Heimdallarchaeota archaeon]